MRMPVRIAKGKTRFAARTSPGARKAAGKERLRVTLSPAHFIAPMKALSVDTVPAGRWRLEVKLDGYRAIAVLNGNSVELWSRHQKPLTSDYPEVVEALQCIR